MSPRLVPLVERARAWGLSPSRARELAQAGRIPGAIRVGGPRRGTWLVPEDEPPPPRLPPGRPRNEEPRR